MRRVGQNHIYIRCTYGILGREITVYTVINGVSIWFWPTLRMCQTRTYTHAHACTHTPMHTHARMHTYIHTHTHPCTHTRTHAHIHTRTHTHVCTHTYTCTYTHAHTRMHAHIHTRTHTHAHTHACTHTQGSGVLEIALDPVTNRTGDMWHVCVMGLKDIGMMCYGWRADGDVTWESE